MAMLVKRAPQWVDPGRSWWIDASTLSFHVPGQSSVRRYDTSGGGAEGGEYLRLWEGSDVRGSPEGEEGLQVLATTTVAPVWAVLTGEGRHQFRSVQLEDRPVLGCGTPVEALSPNSVRPMRETLVQHEGLVVGSVGDRLMAWAVDGAPVLVHEQVLPFPPHAVALA